MPADLPLNFCSDEEGAPLGVSSVLAITGLSPLIAELKKNDHGPVPSDRALGQPGPWKGAACL